MLKLRLLSAALLTCVACFAAQAHGPTPQKVEETIEIAAPPEKVWAVIKDFGNIADWNPALTKSAGTGGNENNATRVITLKKGGELTEGLDYYSDKEMSYLYRLSKENVDVMPVSSYTAEITVKPGADGGSQVSWVGRLYRADTGNEPPPEKNDEAAVTAVKDFFTEGLQGIKAKAEAK